MNGRMLAGIAVFLLLYTAINGFVGWHGWWFVSQLAPGFSPAAYGVLFVLLAFGYLLGRIPIPKRLQPAGRLLKVVGSYYFAVLEFALLFILAAYCIGWIWDLAGWKPDRYAYFAGWCISGLIVILLVWGSRNAWSPVVRKYTLQIDKQPEGLDRLRIVVASDIHLGNIVGKRHLRRLVAHTQALNPDVILLPGDVIDDSIEPFVRNRLHEWLKRLKAKHGVFAVLGNHEYYGGQIEPYVERMREIGIPVLRDELAEIADGAVIIAGRKDRTAESMDPDGRMTVEQLLSQADRTKPIILMDHQPYQFDLAAKAGADLLICGHTHRGQFAPNHLITRRLFELDWGYMRKDRMHVVVSSGFGSWGPPIRLASRSELILIELAFSTGAPSDNQESTPVFA
jgi:hypothetical protein